MADLAKLRTAADKAVAACNTAPFIVRSHLEPLREFVTETVAALDAINAAGGCPGNQEKES